LKAHVAELAVKLAEERLQESVGAQENKRLVLRFRLIGTSQELTGAGRAACTSAETADSFT
jgi:hypothetical protein